MCAHRPHHGVDSIRQTLTTAILPWLSVLLLARFASALQAAALVLHALAPFLCMYTLWGIETNQKARFNVRSKLHAVLDLLGYLLLIMTAQNMIPCAAYRSDSENYGQARIIGTLLLALVLWILRILELALWSDRESARRQSSSDLVGVLGVLILWVQD